MADLTFKGERYMFFARCRRSVEKKLGDAGETVFKRVSNNMHRQPFQVRNLCVRLLSSLRFPAYPHAMTNFIGYPNGSFILDSR